MALEPPIIIVGDGQVEMFGSTQRLEACIEAVDAHLYRAYDSKGRPVRLTGQYKERRFLWLRWVTKGAVTAEAANDEPPQAEQLREALLEWWGRTGGADRAGSSEGFAQRGLDQMLRAIAVSWFSVKMTAMVS